MSRRVMLASQTPSNLGRVLAKATSGVTSNSYSSLRASYLVLRPQHLSSQRQFSTTPATRLDFFPPQRNLPNIKLTSAAWKHPICSEDQMKAIQVAHRECKTWSDWTALSMVRLLRWGTDLATGYRHDPSKPYIMTERKWLVRFVFLETVAGVPGMVGAMLRHLGSLRRMQRDNGWIETLLEEAYNERMHLLTFLKMAEPGWFMKLMIIGAQGVFTNGMFVAYLLSPKTCHRFVGYLEEEAVRTYTYAIEDIEAGRLPKWNDMDAPEIAINYWNMPEGHRKMKDLLLYIRADEAKHREVNHTLGNLDQKEDPNPFVSQYKDTSKPHPSGSIEHLKPTGWERKEVI